LLLESIRGQVSAIDTPIEALPLFPRSAANDANVRWTRELAEVMRPFTTGSDYVSQIGLGDRRGI
jgi:hypothetical protein